MMEQANEKKMDAVNALGEGVLMPRQSLKLHGFWFLIAFYEGFQFQDQAFCL